MSTNSQPLAKRKRTDSLHEESATSGDLMRSDIWYGDGNVILQAGGTQFKVHQSILAESSTVFKDMFSFPQPPSASQELLEGCQIVRLSDTAEEVRYILQAICRREHVAFGKSLPLPILSAFFFLGRKYGIRILFIEAQERLYKEFPLDLEDVDVSTVGGWGVIKDAPYVDLAIFARKAGLLSVLPHILYGCCDSYTPREITAGVLIGLSDDSVRYLPIQDQIICLSGYQAIFKAQAETTHRWIHNPDHFYFCCACQSSRLSSLNKRFTPLPVVSGLDAWGDSDFECCGSCIEGAKMEHRIGREEFWELLPSLFDLPSWEELRKEREDLLREGTNYDGPRIVVDETGIDVKRVYVLKVDAYPRKYHAWCITGLPLVMPSNAPALHRGWNLDTNKARAVTGRKIGLD